MYCWPNALPTSAKANISVSLLLAAISQVARFAPIWIPTYLTKSDNQ